MECIDYELYVSNAIILKKPHKGATEYLHFCNHGDNESEWEKQECMLHFDQYQDKCQFEHVHHPWEIDMVNTKKHNINTSCGYILMKVLFQQKFLKFSK